MIALRIYFFDNAGKMLIFIGLNGYRSIGMWGKTAKNSCQALFGTFSTSIRLCEKNPFHFEFSKFGRYARFSAKALDQIG